MLVWVNEVMLKASDVPPKYCKNLCLDGNTNSVIGTLTIGNAVPAAQAPVAVALYSNTIAGTEKCLFFPFFLIFLDLMIDGRFILSKMPVYSELWLYSFYLK
ncbi:MAG: hypothetical protein LBI18_02310 [Planctomycetaceae bacterium]|nr:hypothetical protein [Planctomycetaceae bacterium]